MLESNQVLDYAMQWFTCYTSMVLLIIADYTVLSFFSTIFSVLWAYWVSCSHRNSVHYTETQKNHAHKTFMYNQV